MKVSKFLTVAAVATLSVACIRVPGQFVTLNDGQNGASMPNSYKEGKACSILGLFGDNSVAKAAKDAGIRKVSTSSFANDLGIVTCTYVQGN